MSDYEQGKKALINEMPRRSGTDNTFRSLKMNSQGDIAQYISDIVPRRQEDHPNNSQSYKQKDGEDF